MKNPNANIELFFQKTKHLQIFFSKKTWTTILSSKIGGDERKIRSVRHRLLAVRHRAMTNIS